MLKTFHGSCHCGAVTYEADLDLSAGTSRCNCTICTKSRNWGIGIKPDAFRLTAGEDNLADYSRSDAAHHRFCRTCGIKTHGHGEIPEIGGAYVSVVLATLNDVTPEELIAAPVTYCDGRNNNWWNPPAETRHL
ncbi:glutathione-dependent formaldehyde-activating enzyme [Variibacter gotjawalensis]|uniref:Glutathione-dependent formaldehyde-activating enzyme n=1 Tax=Variibacter gotjawalensis TaxID=1333996 RepID=A0A0S3PRJ6_9BRAD|nr:GFA family protein [Variibacter gotjawalensis]NIK48798.1 hypothetical protein [Variibacter gotjawalensis]RZS50659.1 hypothetical protein EV661_3126 [Variibacter gotjawalensis]BAT58492.1 glutathione-dependent formaldehyde-activating enzyme [Variibacter gotjawalensis]